MSRAPVDPPSRPEDLPPRAPRRGAPLLAFYGAARLRHRAARAAVVAACERRDRDAIKEAKLARYKAHADIILARHALRLIGRRVEHAFLSLPAVDLTEDTP